jgi:hypothetical protein
MARPVTPPTGEAPSGLPPDQPEDEPMGPSAPVPEGEGEPERGPDAMPGIPTEGDPPAAS